MSVPVKVCKKAVHAISSVVEIDDCLKIMEQLLGIDGFNGNFKSSIEDIKTALLKEIEKRNKVQPALPETYLCKEVVIPDLF
jgi:hypothetical protein